MGEKEKQAFQLTFNGFLKVDFQGSRVTSDGGQILVRELDERLGLGRLIDEHRNDSRQGSNKRFTFADLLRQSVYSHLMGYENLKEAERVSADPTFRLIDSQRNWYRRAALTSTLHGFETEMLVDWFSRQLSKRCRQRIDLRWALCPVQGAPKITSFVTLFAGRGFKIAVFAEYHEGQKTLIDKLEESDLLEPDHLLKTSTYAGQDEADIEDVIGRGMYVHLVNGCLEFREPHLLPAFKPSGAPERVEKEVEAHCALLPPGFPNLVTISPSMT